MDPIRVFVVLIASALCAGLAGCDGSGSGSGGGGGPGSGISTFSKSYGGPLHDEARVVLEADDGGFMLFGSVDGDDLNDNPATPAVDRGAPSGGDFWAQKLDANGNLVQGRRIGGKGPPPDTDWLRARPTSDGGALLVGTRVIRRDIEVPGGGAVAAMVGRDMAVAKLGPDHDVVWSVSFDSGPWPGYEYFIENAELPQAQDKALDAWPLDDGGLLVVGTSKANLADRGGSGFPRCRDRVVHDLVYSEDGFSLIDCVEPVQDTFIEAFSIVVLRLNADGSLRWQRRITDNAFGLEHSNEDSGLGPLGPLIRGTSEGGAIVVRGIVGGSLAYRLETNGVVRWRAALPGLRLPTGVFQTDDPVASAPPDGERDDGFVVAGFDAGPWGLEDAGAVFKLGRTGAVEWKSEHEHAGFHDVTQRCDYAGEVTCHVIAVGFHNEFPSLETRSLAMVLEDDGSVRDELLGVEGSGPVTRIRGVAGDHVFQLLAFDNGRLRRRLLSVFVEPQGTISYSIANNTVAIGSDYEPSSNTSVIAPSAELCDDGRTLVLQEHGSELHYWGAPGFLDRPLELQAIVPLRGVVDNDRLQAAVQIGRGRYVLAGSRETGPLARSTIVVARYDSDDNGERIIWQRELAPGSPGTVLAAARSNSSVVLSVKLSTPPEEPIGEPRIGRLIRLHESDGRVLWQLSLGSYVAHELLRLPDGSFAALTRSIGSSDRLLPRVLHISPSGDVLWWAGIQLEAAGTLTAMSVAADGGVVVAGSTGTTVNLVHIGPDGTLVGAADVRLDALTASPDFDASRLLLTPAQAAFDDLHIRQTADGGFVLAMTAADLIGFLSRDKFITPPAGQTDVLAVKLDASFQPQWAHLYGAHFDERVRDLLVRTDGTIAIAGYSDSLGDRREAWLLKLSSAGLVSAGCQTLLHSFKVNPAATSPRAARVGLGQLLTSGLAAITTTDPELPSGGSGDLITARQCSGDGATGEEETWRLTVQTEGRRGSITSLPAGISCGTMAEICAADFPRGSLVELRAEPDRFVAWRSPCEADSGGTQLRCVVRLESDRTVIAEFRPEAPSAQFTLSFEIRGPGAVRAGDINCLEDVQPEGCSLPFSDGALVSVAVFPRLDWLGTGEDATFVGWSGDPSCSTLGSGLSGFITVDHDIHCIAEFREPNVRLFRVTVSGAGIVTDNPPHPVGEPGFGCREGMVGGGCQAHLASTGPLPLLATADFGQVFAGWGGDCASFGTAASIVVTVANNMNCTARFEQGTTAHRLTVLFGNGAANRIVESVEPAGRGIICFVGPGADCSESYQPGTEVILRPNFAGVTWGSCDSTFENDNGIRDCHVLMDDTDRAVTAQFPPF